MPNGLLESIFFIRSLISCTLVEHVSITVFSTGGMLLWGCINGDGVVPWECINASRYLPKDVLMLVMSCYRSVLMQVKSCCRMY